MTHDAATSQGRKRRAAYAARLVGEFVVIVVGVLVALAVDEWREGRAERVREMAYYGSLAADLERDVEEYDGALELTARSLAAARQVLAVVRGEEPDEVVGSLAHAVAWASWVNYPAWSSGTFDELMASGSIRLIRDLDLKTAMMRYYDTVNEWRPRLQGPEYGTFLEYRRATRGYLPRGLNATALNDQVVDLSEAERVALARRLEGNEELRFILRGMIDDWDTVTAVLGGLRSAAAELQTRMDVKASEGGRR